MDGNTDFEQALRNIRDGALSSSDPDGTRELQRAVQAEGARKRQRVALNLNALSFSQGNDSYNR